MKNLLKLKMIYIKLKNELNKSKGDLNELKKFEKIMIIKILK